MVVPHRHMSFKVALFRKPDSLCSVMLHFPAFLFLEENDIFVLLRRADVDNASMKLAALKDVVFEGIHS
jgi:hypothetical protein